MAGEVSCTVRAERYAGTKSGIVRRSDRRWYRRSLQVLVFCRIGPVVCADGADPFSIACAAVHEHVHSVDDEPARERDDADVVKKLFPVYHRSTMP